MIDDRRSSCGAKTETGLRDMDEAQSIAILVVAATSFWVFIALKKRIEFLEHEVRWLRSELNDIKLVDSDAPGP